MPDHGPSMGRHESRLLGEWKKCLLWQSTQSKEPFRQLLPGWLCCHAASVPAATHGCPDRQQASHKTALPACLYAPAGWLCSAVKCAVLRQLTWCRTASSPCLPSAPQQHAGASRRCASSPTDAPTPTDRCAQELSGLCLCVLTSIAVAALLLSIECHTQRLCSCACKHYLSDAAVPLYAPCSAVETTPCCLLLVPSPCTGRKP